MSMHNAHLAVHFFVGYGLHKVLTVPPVPPPALLPHMSGTTIINIMIKAKVATRELGWGGIPLVGRENDAQYGVPHVTIPMAPPNSILPLTIFMGGSKVMFGSSMVKIMAPGETDCGCCVFPAIPLSINLACNDPCNLPSDAVVAPNTVEVGMSLGDILAGIVSTVIDIGFSWIVGKISGGVNGAVAGAFARRVLGNRAASEAFFDYAGEFGENWIARAAASGARDRVAKEFANTLEGAVGEHVMGAINEFVTKPLVQGATTPIASGLLGSPGESTGDAADSLGRSAAGEPNPQGGQLYSTDNPHAETSDSIWD